MLNFISFALIFVWLFLGFQGGVYKTKKDFVAQDLKQMKELVQRERAEHQQEVRRLKTNNTELRTQVSLLSRAFNKKPKVKVVYKEKPVYKTVYKEKLVYRTIYQPVYRPAYEPSQLTKFFCTVFRGY